MHTAISLMHKNLRTGWASKWAEGMDLEVVGCQPFGR
jgi:hypothetical protein